MDMLPKTSPQWIVIGGTGQTGHRVLQFILSEQKNARVVATSRNVTQGKPTSNLSKTIEADIKVWTNRIRWVPLDLELGLADLAKQLKALAEDFDHSVPTVLVFAAAYTNVDGCEQDPELCYRINEQNTIATLKWGLEHFAAKPVFYSTDYVFDGTKGPYDENTPRSAVSTYGSSKVHVEEWIEKNCSDFLILRTTGVYDYLPGSKNFLMQMIELWGQKKQTRIPNDQFSNPVWAADLAKATVELVSLKKTGIYNIAGGSFLARVDFAKLIANQFHFDESLILPVTTAALSQKARRPLRGGLVCEKINAELGWKPGIPKDVFQRFIK